MKHIFILLLCVLIGACSHQNPLSGMNFQTITAPPHIVAGWYKITSLNSPLKVYIEDDGPTMTSAGYPSDNPTPQDEFLRDIAAHDPSPNVAYLGRPCQYLQVACTVADWTTGRFSDQIITSMDTAVLSFMKKAHTDRVILIGYGGGAQVAGLIAVRHPNQVARLITIAGILDHTAWTNYHNLSPLSDSLNLWSYQAELSSIPQTHYVGAKDSTVPPDLFAPIGNTILVRGATHNTGYGDIISQIYEVSK